MKNKKILNKKTSSCPPKPLYPIGTYVRIINHKFPELHPATPAPGVVRALGLYGKYIQYRYILKGFDVIGKEGKIIEIRTEPYCDYEVQTGEIASYVVRFQTGGVSWVGKIKTFYPEEVERIEGGDKDNKKKP